MIPTPSQTVGPFFSIALPGDSSDLVEPGAPDAIRLWGVVTDGTGEPMPDALIELWQADAGGVYPHPEDPSGAAREGFPGFGRAETDSEGRYAFTTVKPGRVAAPGGGSQAPHISLGVFARGLLKRAATRVYFADEDNHADPVLAAVPEPRRDTLLGRPDREGGYRFDLCLQGDRETVFFDI